MGSRALTARAVCAPPAPRLLRCPLASRGAAFTWEKPDGRGDEALTRVMLNAREVGPGRGCPHGGCPHLRAPAGVTRFVPRGPAVPGLSAVPAVLLPPLRSARPSPPHPSPQGTRGMFPAGPEPERAVPPLPASTQAWLSRGPRARFARGPAPRRGAHATGGMLPRIAAEPLRT